MRKYLIGLSLLGIVAVAVPAIASPGWDRGRPEGRNHHRRGVTVERARQHRRLSPFVVQLPRRGRHEGQVMRFHRMRTMHGRDTFGMRRDEHRR